MHDELDPDLAKAFAQVRAPLADDDFAASVLRKIERARRARLWRQILIMAGAVILLSLNTPLVLDRTAAAMRAVGELAPLSTDFLTTPLGWAACILIGAGLLVHLRPTRRR
jgi:hypothetical protein